MKDIKAFYDNNLKAVIGSLEAEKVRTRNKLLMYIIVPAVVLLLIAVGYYFSSKNFVPAFLVLFFSLTAYHFISKKITKPYEDKFKTSVISRLVKFVDEDLDYEHHNYIRESAFRESRLYDHRIDKYEGEDYISGKIGKTQIEFSEVLAKYKKRDKDDKTEWHTLFDGLFFTADFNKEFKSDLILKPDIAERLFGGFGQKLQSINVFQHGELVKLENPEFEKAFKVVGTDQTEARYILTPALMEKILKLNNEIMTKEKSMISMSFINSKIYLALPLNRDLFEPSIFGKKVVKEEDIIEYYHYIKLMAGIVEDLDLNTRIWTKK
ncbi:MAG: DUF3137 domain-containing protein [Halanaerobiales bacterium]